MAYYQDGSRKDSWKISWFGGQWQLISLLTYGKGNSMKKEKPHKIKW